MNDNKQTPKTLDDILAEMRNAAKDSYAEKTAKRLEDHEATGTRDALDINDAIQCLRDDDKYLLDLADRIERAAKNMENAFGMALAIEDGLRKQQSAPGDAAALREALEYVLQFDASDEAAEEDGLTDAERIAEYADHIEECQKKARAALAATPRNCDVGTAEEQQNRFREFCRRYESKGECGIGRSKAACPAFHGCRNPDCSLWWAQMPYEGKEKSDEQHQ